MIREYIKKQDYGHDIFKLMELKVSAPQKMN